MHIDFAHALVAGLLIFLSVEGLKRLGVIEPRKGWNWRVFFTAFVVVFVLNLVWPYG